MKVHEILILEIYFRLCNQKYIFKLYNIIIQKYIMKYTHFYLGRQN